MDILRDVLRHPLKPALRPPVVRASGGKARWRPELMALPPTIAVDAYREDLFTLDGSRLVTAARTVHTNQLANTPAFVTHMTSNPLLNGKPSLNVPGTSASQTQSLNFATAHGGMLSGKAGCTMIFLGCFADAAPGAFNTAIVNATTTSSSSTRCSIATSSTNQNCPRSVVRRQDGDVTAKGDDYGTANFGQSPWIGVLRLDHGGVVIGAGVAHKEFQICTGGLATGVQLIPTGLGNGTFTVSNCAYIGFFNSGTVAYARVNMIYGAIFDRVLSNAEVEIYQGWLAHERLGLPSILHSSHPYFLNPPLF